MKPLTNALVWASAIILFALLATSGPIDSETAQTMLIMLPVLAWATMGQATRCKPCRAAGSVARPDEPS